MLNLEGLGVRHLGTRPDLEGFVGQLSAYPTTHVTVGIALVLMEYIDDAAMMDLGHGHLFFDDNCGLGAIVDVENQVFRAIDNHEVGLELLNGNGQQFTPFLPADATDVEDEKLVVEILAFPLREGEDAFDEDLLGGLGTLFGIVPENTDGFVTDTLQGEDVLLMATGHDDGKEECFTTLRFSCVGHEF